MDYSASHKIPLPKKKKMNWMVFIYSHPLKLWLPFMINFTTQSKKFLLSVIYKTTEILTNQHIHHGQTNITCDLNSIKIVVAHTNNNLRNHNSSVILISYI